MSPEEFHDLTALEAALTSLTPRPSQLDRDQLMFQAGGLTARRSRFWPAVSGVMAVAASTLLVLLLQRPGPQVTERVVYVPRAPVPAPRAPASHPAVTSPPTRLAQAAGTEEFTSRSPRQALEEQILRWGLDALPESTPSLPSEPPLTLESLLGVPVKPEQRPGLLHLGSWFQDGDRS